MQCAAFLAGMFSSRLARRVLIVAPKTLLLHWAKELAVCGLAARTHSYYTASEAERAAALRAVASPARGAGGIMLTTYGMVLHNMRCLRIREDGRPSEKRGPLAKLPASGGREGPKKGGGGASGWPGGKDDDDDDDGGGDAEDDEEDLVPWDMIILDGGRGLRGGEEGGREYRRADNGSYSVPSCTH